MGNYQFIENLNNSSISGNFASLEKFRDFFSNYMESKNLVFSLFKGVDNNQTIVRTELELKTEVSPLDWLAGQDSKSKIYWQGRDGIFEVAGVGETDLVQGKEIDFNRFFTLFHPDTSNKSHLKYYGGLRFNPAHSAGTEWDIFGTFRFVLPKYELYRNGERHFFACNLQIKRNSSWEDTRNELRECLERVKFTHIPPNWPLLQPLERKDLPQYSQWQKNIEKVLNHLNVSAMEKVVLARRTSFIFSEPPDPLSLMAFLRDRSQKTFNFCFQPENSNAFVGVSPELLYRRKGSLLQSEAVAGTRTRGKFFKEDLKNEKELLNSDKDLWEHQLVCNHVRGTMDVLCDSVKEDRGTRILKLEHVQHLYTRYYGKLNSGVFDKDILNSLHPTPAVGGHPCRSSLPIISELEHFDRGWYGGPVGWIAGDSAEFAVAIRSGLISGNTIDLYSGAGIVKGSVANAEWKELEAKIKKYLKIWTKPCP